MTCAHFRAGWSLAVRQHGVDSANAAAGSACKAKEPHLDKVWADRPVYVQQVDIVQAQTVQRSAQSRLNLLVLKMVEVHLLHQGCSCPEACSGWQHLSVEERHLRPMRAFVVMNSSCLDRPALIAGVRAAPIWASLPACGELSTKGVWPSDRSTLRMKGLQLFRHEMQTPASHASLQALAHHTS